MNLGIIDAIAKQEGFGVFGSRATRNNNPGNLNFEPWLERDFAATLEVLHHYATPRFAAFESPELGYQALRTLLTGKAYKGLTVAQMVEKYAPGTENNTHAYILAVCSMTGLSPDTIIDDNL